MSGTKDSDPQTYVDQMNLFVGPLKDGWKPEDVIYETVIKEGYMV